jgi:hypothetical protein
MLPFSTQGDFMHTLDPSVVEAWEAQAERQEQLALAAWNKSDTATRDIFKAAAIETRAKIDRYKRDSIHKRMQRAVASVMVATSVGEGAALPFHRHAIVPTDHVHGEAPAEFLLVGKASDISYTTASVIVYSRLCD